MSAAKKKCNGYRHAFTRKVYSTAEVYGDETANGISAAGVVVLIFVPGVVSAKEETVTLEVTGMSWGSCASAVRSALQDVKGVKEAVVSMEKKEAVVNHDADVTNVDALIKAVKEADGPHAPYDAKVKKK